MTANKTESLPPWSLRFSRKKGLSQSLALEVKVALGAGVCLHPRAEMT